MSKKCEWKDGKFEACAFLLQTHRSGKADTLSTALIRGFKVSSIPTPRYCPFCGADIRKPEPEVIIKQSGGTWVGECWGMSFIWFTSERGPDMEMDANHFSLLVKHGKWILFRNKDGSTPLTITDEIAKLRPMVIIEDGSVLMSGDVRKLTYIDEEMINTTHMVCTHKSIKSIRLATVSDLP